LQYLILNLKFWFIGNIKKYFPILNQYIRSTTSIITINHENDTVYKETVRYLEFRVVENEIYWLKKLSDFEHTPNIIDHNKNKITLSYAGEPLTSKNLPIDWEKQIEKILDKLNEINCSHNDIKPTDLLMLNNKIMLIDFQWASNVNQSLSTNLPKSIGGIYKSKNGFNDRYSIYKSIHFIQFGN
tara:strand:+ start:75 stop:629 length:555 start_codon:yes stop_codon:yes gene_type:complete